MHVLGELLALALTSFALASIGIFLGSEHIRYGLAVQDAHTLPQSNGSGRSPRARSAKLAIQVHLTILLSAVQYCSMLMPFALLRPQTRRWERQ